MADKTIRICLGEGGEIEGVTEKCVDIPHNQIEALIDGKAVIVPVEPTEEMLKRGAKEIYESEMRLKPAKLIAERVYKSLIQGGE